MAQLTKGARAAIEKIADLASEMAERGALARERTKSNPDFAQRKLEALPDLAAAIKRALREDLEPLLLRQAPSLEQRVAELEQRIAQLEDGRIITLRREA